MLDRAGPVRRARAETLEGGLKVYGMFAQDTWRLKPNLTLTGGLRYDIQTPFNAVHAACMSAVTMDSICGASGVGDGGALQPVQRPQPGALPGGAPRYILLEKGTQGYKTDLNNLAPSVSIAWRPDVQSGFLRAILGDPEPGDGSRRLLRSLRPPGLTTVHRPLWRQPRRLDLAEPRRQHRAGAGRASRGRSCSRRRTA